MLCTGPAGKLPAGPYLEFRPMTAFATTGLIVGLVIMAAGAIAVACVSRPHPHD
jgi:hypothetical protein